MIVDQDTWDYLGSHPHDMDNDTHDRIVSPEMSATFTNELTVEFSVSNFTIGSTGDDVDGHIHYSLDGGDPVMHYTTDPISVSDLSLGAHTFSLWLVDNNHNLLDPSVGDTIEFTVAEQNTVTSIYDIQYVEDPDTDDASPLNGQEVTIQGTVTAEFWGSNNIDMFVQIAKAPGMGLCALNMEDGIHFHG